MNPLAQLHRHGQSWWLDSIRRGLIEGGELGRLIEEDDLRGVTSNPAIFEKAITGSNDYAGDLARLSREFGDDAKAIYERLAIDDIRGAADLFEPTYRTSARQDGCVSLEVSPHLAHDTAGTLDEARRLWAALDRPNVMIKVPATPAGIPAIQTLIAEGINVNVTLLFSRAVYEQVIDAYLTGLDQRMISGGDVSGIASVASFFVSRIDTAVDRKLEAKLEHATSGEERMRLRRLAGSVAIANAKLAYQLYKQRFDGERWQALAERGARPQRLLWASTGTKNPAYSDVLYVESLIGADTVNTLPPATADAFREHGRVVSTLDADVEEARRTLIDLDDVGVSLDRVTDQLLEDGVRLFAEPFDKLLGAIGEACAGQAMGLARRQSIGVPAALSTAVEAETEAWKTGGRVRRVWARDATLWTGGDEAAWLGWLDVADKGEEQLETLRAIGAETRDAGFTHALLLGMGGSSLCPDVLARTFGVIDGYPALHVLDSTDPAQVVATERAVDLERTLVIVSSKSGTTLEPNIFKEYFHTRLRQVLGDQEAGRRMIAITDPGSQLEEVARRDGFRHVFAGDPSIGGRYSALSNFGLVPAAIMGLDVERFLDRAQEMVQACAACVPPGDNPGVALGIALGVLGEHGRDKLTIVTSPGLRSLGAWLEQLVAESTGKQGKALIPVDGERLADPALYGEDRVFVHLRLAGDDDATAGEAIARLEQAGHPVIRIEVADRYDLGQEFYRWEIATAVAGSVLGINPFDQPDVEASKVATRRLTTEVENTGALPPETSLVSDGDLKLFTDPRNAETLARATRGTRTVESWLAAHLARLGAGDYFALLAYLHMNERHTALLEEIRHRVRDTSRVATCLGFGPRFLHSTGQAYKGGPETGVFLQVTCEDAQDLPVPDRGYTFGTVKNAQARGDFAVLAERARRVLRVHLSGDTEAGLLRLRDLVAEAATITARQG